MKDKLLLLFFGMLSVVLMFGCFVFYQAHIATENQAGNIQKELEQERDYFRERANNLQQENLKNLREISDLNNQQSKVQPAPTKQDPPLSYQPHDVGDSQLELRPKYVYDFFLLGPSSTRKLPFTNITPGLQNGKFEYSQTDMDNIGLLLQKDGDMCFKWLYKYYVNSLDGSVLEIKHDSTCSENTLSIRDYNKVDIKFAFDRDNRCHGNELLCQNNERENTTALLMNGREVFELDFSSPCALFGVGDTCTAESMLDFTSIETNQDFTEVEFKIHEPTLQDVEPPYHFILDLQTLELTQVE